MKTSNLEVHDMLSVLSVDDVEKRIGEVPGVESVTVNFAAGSATVRYDETRLGIGDIKSAVHQRGYEAAAPAAASAGDSHEGHTATAPSAPTAPPGPAVTKAASVAPAAAPAPTSAAPKSAPDAAAAAPASAGDEQRHKAAPDKS